MEFNAAKDDEDDCDNWSYKTFKAPAKLSPPTDQHQTFYRPDALPVAQPTVSKHWRKKETANTAGKIRDDDFWRLTFSSDADIVRLTNARIIIIII